MFRAFTLYTIIKDVEGSCLPRISGPNPYNPPEYTTTSNSFNITQFMGRNYNSTPLIFIYKFGSIIVFFN